MMLDELRAQLEAARTRLPDLPVTVLHIGAERSVLARTPDQFAMVELGSATVAALYFEHAPPTAGELEAAIARVEDELHRAQALDGGGGQLFTTDPAIGHVARLAGLPQQPLVQLSREAVERTFDRLAAVAEGRPAAVEGLPADPAFAATLLILRECMHHLDFTAIAVQA